VASGSPVQLAQARTEGTTSDLPKELQDFVKGSSNRTNQGGADAVLSALAALELHVDDGAIAYADARTGVDERVTALHLRLSFRGADQPLTASGRMTVRNEPFDFDGRLGLPSGKLAVELFCNGGHQVKIDEFSPQVKLPDLQG
jgi:hypothetical protein